jgi:hypothetical protein
MAYPTVWPCGLHVDQKHMEHSTSVPKHEDAQVFDTGIQHTKALGMGES